MPAPPPTDPRPRPNTKASFPPKQNITHLNLCAKHCLPLRRGGLDHRRHLPRRRLAFIAPPARLGAGRLELRSELLNLEFPRLELLLRTQEGVLQLVRAQLVGQAGGSNGMIQI